MLPHRIEQESFKIIRSEMGEHSFNDEELAIVVRVIHATADFDFAHIIRFHPQAIMSGLEAIRSGKPILTDVEMVKAGISSPVLTKFGGKVFCDIRSNDVRSQAQEKGLTRSTMAMRKNMVLMQGGIIAIGNAPTALLEVIRLIQEDGIRPALIVGVPVGFVNAAESKDELLKLDVPYISCLGRKGGSTVAAAIINALLKLAEKECAK